MNHTDLCQTTLPTEPARRHPLSALALLLLVPTLALATAGCEKDEAPPPLPSAKPADTAVAPLELEEEEDAGAEEEEEPKKTGTGRPSSTLKNCCSALRQNAASAPPATQGLMLQAAATCDAMAASGQTGVGPLQAILKGASLPAGCR
jgi:hypothetical protein